MDQNGKRGYPLTLARPTMEGKEAPMFTHHCTACGRRELIFPSQVVGLENTDQGIVVRFACWCDAEQTLLTGADVPAPATPAVAA